MNQVVIKIAGRDVMRPRMYYAWKQVGQMLSDGALELIIQPVCKSRPQERHYHALINEIAEQVLENGELKSAEWWKAILVDDFEQELLRQGVKLAHPSEIVLSRDGRRAITLRSSTSKFRASEARDFIEYLYSFGIDNGVRWSTPATDIYKDYANVKETQPI